LAQLRTLIGSGTGPHGFDWDAIAEDLNMPGLPSDYKCLHEEYGSKVVLNGIFIAGPHELASMHQTYAEYLPNWSKRWDSSHGTGPEQVYTVHPDPGGLVYCGSTEGRVTLCWDTREPDPDRWPVVGDKRVFPACVGLGLTDSGLGDPDDWAWPFKGPRGTWLP
jgi:hypothetical protein